MLHCFASRWYIAGCGRELRCALFKIPIALATGRIVAALDIVPTVT